MEWHPISLAPPNERILVCNELWDDTFGAVQIAEREGSTWTFDSGMDISDLDAMSLAEGVTAEDFLPKGWARLPISCG